MTGFIKNIFSRRRPLPGEDSEKKVKAEKKQKPEAKKAKREAFYLDSDSAKTLGDIDYMRTARTIRRTFPKVGGSAKGAEIVQEISSMEKKSFNNSDTPSSSQKKPATETKRTNSFSPSSSQTSSSRRRADSNMDMFRDMAREIKKK